MKKAALFLLLFSIFTFNSFSQAEKTLTIEITNVVPEGGAVHVAVFFNAEELRNEKPRYGFELEAGSTAVSRTVTLPHGDYVITGFQDANHNQKMDYAFLRLPKELVGLTNYYGKGIPSMNFDRLKVTVNSTTEKISVGLYKF